MAQGVWARLGAPAPFDPDRRLVTSHFLPPLGLAVVRLVLGVYALVTVCVQLGMEDQQERESYFSYFTHLSYVGLLAYLFASGTQTLVYGLRAGRITAGYDTSAPPYPLQHWPKPLQFLHILLWSTVLTFPIVVTVVYWALLASGATDTIYTTWSNVSVHAMNTGFMLIEVILSRTPPPPWTHVPLLILILACYLAVAYITWYNQGFFVYSFLDWNEQGGLLAAYLVGIAVGEAIVFAIMWGVVWVRDWIFEGRRRRNGEKVMGVAGAERLDSAREMQALQV